MVPSFLLLISSFFYSLYRDSMSSDSVSDDFPYCIPLFDWVLDFMILSF